jgi:hypothetical protein
MGRREKKEIRFYGTLCVSLIRLPTSSIDSSIGLSTKIDEKWCIMTMIEPELITIIEGPTPEFRSSPQEWVQSIQEGPEDRMVAVCQLRTGSGPDILARCQNAWREGRPVKLDFPDELRMRQQVDVVAVRLQELEEGEVLVVWVSLPLIDDEELEEIDEDEDDDDFYYG